jgi:hypothetical protein
MCSSSSAAAVPTAGSARRVSPARMARTGTCICGTVANTSNATLEGRCLSRPDVMHARRRVRPNQIVSVRRPRGPVLRASEGPRLADGLHKVRRRPRDSIEPIEQTHDIRQKQLPSMRGTHIAVRPPLAALGSTLDPLQVCASGLSLCHQPCPWSATPREFQISPGKGRIESSSADVVGQHVAAASLTAQL